MGILGINPCWWVALNGITLYSRVPQGPDLSPGSADSFVSSYFSSHFLPNRFEGEGLLM